VARRLAEAGEIAAFGIRHGRLPLAGVEDLAPWLDRLADAGGSGSTQDFAPILRAVRATEAVRRSLSRADSPHLAARRLALPVFEALLARADRLFGPDGALKDDASPKLASVRSTLRRRRAQVSRTLEKLLEARSDALGDAVVVLRNDRYCLPVLASARGRVPGIVHDRSGSGQTIFVEPIEVIEANNDLALLGAEERREADRILAEFGREVLAQKEPLRAAVRELGALDALEAVAAFAELGDARAPELSDDGGWVLVGARHPLLDARFARLRRDVLGETREGRDAVPLDLDLPATRRLLVVSGPNAGGKTVVLKTAGLLSMLTQCGVPIPAEPGTRLPVFRSIRTEIGDAQAILSDRSTFSSSMETLSKILEDCRPGALALIDEIGGATDPEEGSAIAIAFLEEYIARGGRAIVSTHLSSIKSFAASRKDSICAAMEFDEATGRPNYRLHPGLSGRSHALSVAREGGLPSAVLERARSILGENWERREKAEADAERALDRIRRSEEELARERDRVAREREILEAERRSVSAERARMLEEGMAGFERARRELSRRVERELAEARENARLAQLSAARVLDQAERAAEAEEAVAAAKEAQRERSSELSPGRAARVRGLGAEGTIVALDEAWAELEIRGKRLRVRRSELEPIKTEGLRRRREGGAAANFASRLPSTVYRDLAGDIPEVNVIGQRLDEATETVEKALDQALLAGATHLRVIHGHGTGRLRQGLRERFRAHPSVAASRAGGRSEGGNGATILELR